MHAQSRLVYAKTKLEGEKKVLHWLPDSLIIRTAFYGWNLHNMSSLGEWVIDNLRNNQKINMFTDAYFTPILANNLAEVILEMYRNGLGGIYHVDGSERCSKYHFGLAIAQAFELNKNNIDPISIDVTGKDPHPITKTLEFFVILAIMISFSISSSYNIK